MNSNIQPLASSYRDPSGFMFEANGVLYRQINNSFKSHFDHFIESGCYAHLVREKLLIPHEEINENITGNLDCYKTIRPERLAFISYPYEWSFDMLKDAALLTLQLAKECLSFGVILKDATPYNIQWHNGKMIFIDTLSFEKYNETEPWIAYRQFCECLLGPLLLMHYSRQHLQNLMLAYPEGVPLSIVKSLLPFRSRFSFFTSLHIYLHERLTRPGKQTQQKTAAFSKTKILNLLNSLESLVKNLKASDRQTNWSEYYGEAGQRGDYVEQKKNIIDNWLNNLPGTKTAVDLGANDGYFSKLISQKNIYTIAAEADASCVNHLYLQCKKDFISNIHPLVSDLSNPSPAIGVNNNERNSFTSRAKVDLTLALALIHHLCIGRNMNFEQCALFFSQVSNFLIIEFVPKQDEKTQLLLQNKKDIYPGYTENEFENKFTAFFSIKEKQKIPNTERTLYLMKKL
jgi:hypothetical protein